VDGNDRMRHHPFEFGGLSRQGCWVGAFLLVFESMDDDDVDEVVAVVGCIGTSSRGFILSSSS